MKVIGIFLIVLGHTFPTGNQYIYSFSVPVFFLISGFLNSENGGIKKILVNLVIPMLIICVINILPMSALWIRGSEFSIDKVFGYLFNCIIGEQGELEPNKGLGACWFIYSLAIMKTVHIYIKNRELLLILACVIAVVLSLYKLTFHSSWINATVCYPFFYIGSILKKTNFVAKPNFSRRFRCVLFVFSLFALVSLTNYNGTPWCYKNGYGNNFILFILSGLAGCYVLFDLSRMLGAIFSPKILMTFSNGTIVILGFHFWIIIFANIVIQHVGAVFDDFGKYVLSSIIFLMFYPIILFVKRYIPVLLGSRS